MSSKYVVFVCTGNTCRSPMAQVIAQQIFEEVGLALDVLSAGVSAWGGQPASQNALTAMEDMGLNLSNHKSQPTSAELLTNAAIVLAMTPQHLEVIKNTAPTARTVVLGISDPFGGDVETYHRTAREIKQKITQNLDKIREAL